MQAFTSEEIKKALDQLIMELKHNENNFTGLSNEFPYSRNEQRTNKPKFNIIKKFHVPTNYSIEISFMPDCAGRVKWVGKRIILNDILNDIESIKTLIHEWAHMRIHLKNGATKVDLEIKEIEAESVAFIIMCLLGLLDDNKAGEWKIEDSIQYILRYKKETDKTIDDIYNFSSKRILTTVNFILNKYLIHAY